MESELTDYGKRKLEISRRNSGKQYISLEKLKEKILSKPKEEESTKDN